MNYQIESSFMEDETLDIILWAENIMFNFVQSKDEFLGLNRCNGAEKQMIRVLCKSFLVKFCGTPKNTYLKKTAESRVPTLSFLDYFTAKKVAKNYAHKRDLFYDNTRNFR